MGKLLEFRRPDDYADIVALLRELAEEERKLRECEWVEETVRRAKELPRWLIRFPARCAGTTLRRST